MAEETRDPARRLPLAIGITLVVTLIVYVNVALVAAGTLPIDALSYSGAPIVAIGTIAVIDGALIKFIMASGVAYGMIRQGWLPAVFARVHARHRTPVTATATLATLIALLALGFEIGHLAPATSW